MRALFFLLLLAPNYVWAGNDTGGVGPRASAMGGAAVTITDIWSVFNNQAGLTAISQFNAAAFYQNRFLVDNMAYGGLALASPLGKGSMGLSYTSFGYDLYREGKLGLAYALNLSDKLSLGIQLNYQSLRFGSDAYGKSDAFTGEIALRMQLSEQVALGVQLVNPTRTQLNEYTDERIPTIMRLGIGYQISKEVLASAEVAKEIDSEVSFKTGVEYRPVSLIYLRVGASSGPQSFAFGAGLDFGSFCFDLASAYHTVLGFSPQVGLSYQPGHK